MFISAFLLSAQINFFQQALLRGAKARKRAREKRAEREFFKNRTEEQRRSKFGVASVVIERVYRGHFGRRLAQQRRLERAEEAAQNLIMRHKKAARIQSLFKGYRFRNEIRISRRRERVVNASIMLQKVVRGHFGRVLTRFKRFELLETGDGKAACVLQRSYRLRIARRKLFVRIEWFRLSSFTTRIQKMFRGHAARRFFALNVHVYRQYSAARAIQSLYVALVPAIFSILCRAHSSPVQY